MGRGPKCYIPSFVKIGQPVAEKKIFEGFLPYMGMAAISIMLPRCREQTFVPPSHGGPIPKFSFDWPSGFGGEDV